MSSFISSLFLEPVFRRRDRTGSSSSSATNQGGHTFTGNISPPLSRAGSADDSDELLDPRVEEQLGRNQRWTRTTEAVARQQLLPSPLQNLDTQASPGNLALSDRGIQLEGSRALIFCQSSLFENDRTEMSSNSTSHVGQAPVAPAEGEASGSTLHLTEPGDVSTRNPHATQNIAEQPTDVTMEEVGGGEKSPTRLPADDGKTLLRRRIHEIRDTEASNSEKARLVHELMTEEYHSSQSCPESRLPQEARSPASHQSHQGLERPWTPATPQNRYSSDQPSLTPASTTSVALSDDPYYLKPDDNKPSFVPTGEIAGEDFEPRLGCQHYKRNVKLQCFTCKRWYPCRFCHDAVENHSLDRKKTENMLCMLCGSPQPAAERCRKCDKLASWYYCSICKLWDDDNEKSIYHCDDCGICRIGQGLGKDFFHCKTCCVCMPMSIETTHKCIERSTQCDCPICGEYMFTSPETVVFMRCGHSIHRKCFSEYSNTSYRCPICSKTIANMETHFRSLDRTIQSQPMPPEFTDTKALIFCNDCSAKGVVPYHWLGLKCDVCESYNTAQVQLFGSNDLDGEDSAAPSTSREIPMTRHRHPSDANAGNDASAESELHSRSVPAAEGYLGAPPVTPSRTSNRRSSYSTPYRSNPLSLSPVIGNYFGLQRHRESERPTSSTIDELPERNDDNRDQPYFWGRSRSRSKTGFFGDRMGFIGGDDYVEDEDDDDDDEEADDILDDEEDDAEDDEDSIEIFGHR